MMIIRNCNSNIKTVKIIIKGTPATQRDSHESAGVFTFFHSAYMYEYVCTHVHVRIFYSIYARIMYGIVSYNYKYCCLALCLSCYYLLLNLPFIYRKLTATVSPLAAANETQTDRWQWGCLG